MPESEDYWNGRKMRVGRTVGRTLYIVNSESDDRKKDHLVGLVDTPALAEQIALRWNFSTAQQRTGQSTALSARGLAAMDSVSLAHLVLSLLDQSLSAANEKVEVDTSVVVSVDVLH